MIEGRNTDSYGLAESLRETDRHLGGKNAVLLGAGGAARGAVLALEALGAATIHILNRDAGRAQNLAAALASHVNARLVPARFGGLEQGRGRCRLAVNSTSAGMGGIPPLDLDLSGAAERCRGVRHRLCAAANQAAERRRRARPQAPWMGWAC